MRLKKKLIMMLIVLVALSLVMLPTSVIAAADLTKLSDELSTIKASTAADHTIKFKTPTGAGDVGDTIIITLPKEFTKGDVAFGDIDLSHGVSTGAETEETLAAEASATAWGAALTQAEAGADPIVLTLTHPTDAEAGDIAANDYVIVEIGKNATDGVNQITNPSAAGTYQIDITGTFGDDGEIAVVIVTNDEVAVTGRVLPTLSFSLSANATDFGDISAGVIDTATTDIILTISTNGTDGYTVTVKDVGNGTDAAGLWCAAAGNLIVASSTVSESAEGYGIQAAVTTGSPTIDPAYLKTVNDVGILQRTAQTLASNADPADGDQVTITHKASITSITEAGDYVDTITYNVIANF